MNNNIDYYGENADYIHLKFGDARKMYHFTRSFEKKHPNFCDEFRKYFAGEKSKFHDPLEIVNYVEHWNIPVHFYFNFTDTPAKDIQDVKKYLMREHLPHNYGVYTKIGESHEMLGWDGEKEKEEE